MLFMKSRGNGSFLSEFMAVFTSDSSYAIFYPRETNSNTTRSRGDPREIRETLKKKCRFATTKKKNLDRNYDAVATGIPRN